MLTSLAASFFATRVGKLLPSWAWETILIVLLILGAALWHHTRVVSHDNVVRAVQRQADDAAWQKAFDQMHVAANKWKQAAELAGQRIATSERKLNDEENARIAAAGDDLRLRGPGKAAGCRPVDHPALPAASGQPVAPGGQSADDAAGQVPSGDGQPAVVPWDWLVGRAEQADLDRAEVLSWRDWYQRQSAQWGRKP